FAGRRYVVPVGQIEASDGVHTLHTTLSRAELSRYPEFSPSAFSAMEDSDALRYERRLHRVFAPDAAPYDGRPTYENLPVYRTPSRVTTETGAYERSASQTRPTRSAEAPRIPAPVEPAQP